MARTIFTAARKRGLIETNPFAELKAGDQVNKGRLYFVPREDIEKVLRACPDAQWRLMVSLARVGGVRCPLEIVTLRWTDIDWDTKRVLIHSPKTERHEGKETRLIPLFAELEKAFKDLLAEDGEHESFVITRYRCTSTNLRSYLKRIIERAGLERWPKLWQNLRSTRETELGNEYPLHVVCDWIGNTPKIAKEHYLQLTDQHFAKAVGGTELTMAPAEKRRKIHRSKPPKQWKKAVIRRNVNSCGERK